MLVIRLGLVVCNAGEVERWRTKYLLLESRISKLEAEAQELKNGEPVVRVSGENDENAGVENEILDVDAINGEAPEDSAAARSVGLAREDAGVNVSGENDENVEVENEVLNEDATTVTMLIPRLHKTLV
ncbi:hypothetical protein Ddye_002810 [Dipteronia dyeriana]|uniref:Uncharacterized protein n=1 Tax=Dipteronia dyeriana TaxID=168575 RepID=A0AAD9XRP7_9ROSI|nr:hypothetical protein Ddye_002810 [Dipteronia dyeriana]